KTPLRRPFSLLIKSSHYLCPSLLPSHVTLPRLLYSTLMLKEILEQGQSLTAAAVDRLLPPETQHPVSIHKAMRHSVFAGGKRLRPTLCIEAGCMIAGSVPTGIE